MSPCILSKNTGDSDMTLVKDGLTINLPCEQATHEQSMGKEYFGSLVDVHVSVLLLNASNNRILALTFTKKPKEYFS